MDLLDGNLLTYIRDNLVDPGPKKVEWIQSGRPPPEIPIGTMRNTLQYIKKREDPGSFIDTECDNYQVFILPPNEVCAEPNFDKGSQEEALTNVYRSQNGGGVKIQKWPAHMKKSWMITVRMVSIRKRGKKGIQQEGNDVAFALFHHGQEKTVVEMLCVADGSDSTPRRDSGDGSHRGCGLERILATLIHRLLIESFAASTTHTIAALVPSGEAPLTAIYDTMFQQCVKRNGPASVWADRLYEEHWDKDEECTEYSHKLRAGGATLSSMSTSSILPDAKRGGSLVTDLYETNQRPSKHQKSEQHVRRSDESDGGQTSGTVTSPGVARVENTRKEGSGSNIEHKMRGREKQSVGGKRSVQGDPTSFGRQAEAGGKREMKEETPDRATDGQNYKRDSGMNRGGGSTDSDMEEENDGSREVSPGNRLEANYNKEEVHNTRELIEQERIKEMPTINEEDIELETPDQVEDRQDKETDSEEERTEESEEEGGSDSADSDMEDESCQASLRDLVEENYSEEQADNTREVAEEKFQEMLHIYGKDMELPKTCPLPGLPPEIDANIGVGIDIDSCMAHGSQPYKVALSFKAYNHGYIEIVSPNRYQRNDWSTRIHVKTGARYRPAYKNGRCPTKVDMANFPNIVVAYLYVSNYSIKFTMNIHLIQQKLGSIGEEIHVAAWNAALNCARQHYREADAFKACGDKGIKKDLESCLNDSCEFELKEEQPTIKGLKESQPTLRLKYNTGCLFLKIVWEKLKTYAEGERPASREHRMRNWMQYGDRKIEEVRKAAGDLYRDSHTVVQAAGFRKQFQEYEPINTGRPEFSDTKAFHLWLNKHYQLYMKVAVKNFFVKDVYEDVVTFLDVGINFKSKDPTCYILINGNEAQRIVNKQGKVLTEEARRYYLYSDPPNNSDGMETREGGREEVTWGEGLIGQKVRQVRWYHKDYE
jgi:hypothetical protein